MEKPQKPTAADNGLPEVYTTEPSTTDHAASGTLLSQASELLSKNNVSDLLGQLPQSVKSAGNGAMSKINSLSTTQKIVGGALLVAGVGYLASTSGGKAKGKSKSKKNQASTLHELLYFVNDRIVGYQRAVAESQDAKLQGYYKQLVSQSQQFSNTLNNHLRQQDGTRETSTTLKGKLYRAWMDAKALITGFDEKAILGSNIYGEEWALKAYENALDDQTLTGTLRVEVERQYKLSQSTYQELQRLSDKQ
ncbi:PA2169 family four-helix-bundle protein [Hymenobacter sp. BT190]|uniref:PA2169 family four-helix-bundle protein n=1 Tax=Hymenobacter sp. BT190 TaxID=2763505 RepID=UPI001650F02C|nr:PA2169 family four-helix-bundle protein [Hymenobacter sp. BT190]MBC6699832.1 PA2169 family four-helix-bundle protein [Hymenobacter sp. BT190]